MRFRRSILSRSILPMLVACGLFALVACGGGGGVPGGPDAAYLTADARGWTNTTGGGAPLGAAPGAESADAAADVAREVTEADLQRIDGDTLYLLNAYRGLVVVDLATMTIRGRLPLAGFPHEMYVQGGRALALTSGADGLSSLVDVSLANPTAPVESARWPLGAPYRASRLVGDVLYVVTDGEVRSFLIGASVTAVDSATLPHAASFVHATDRVLAVAGWGSGLETPVALVDVSDAGGLLHVGTTLSFPGWMSDEHKMHVAGDVLRVVTHDWTNGGLSHLRTVDVADVDLPVALGALDLARGEQLFATRFTDDFGFVVTFEQVDPLWVIDLRNPAAPSLAGSLVVPGWSTQLVPLDDGRIVALGVDPADGWRATVSLFDVSTPSMPALLDRADLGQGWSSAASDPKGFGVFPADGLVLVPFAGDPYAMMGGAPAVGTGDRLDVLDLGAATLDFRGAIDATGLVLRGATHVRGILATSVEEVVLADRSTLAVLGRVTIAENVVDACRLPDPDGRSLSLVATSVAGRLGDVALPLVPQRLYPHGFQVAVVGWDDQGRACRVVDFSGAAPVVSARFALGDAWFVLGDPTWGAPAPMGIAREGMGPSASDAVLTAAGRLVSHGLPGLVADGAPPPLGGGTAPSGPAVAGTTATDGFVVIDVVTSHLEAPVLVVGGVVSGFTADGEDLLYTVGTAGSPDAEARPRLRHDLVRVDLATRATSTPVNVPGWVIAAEGDLHFSVKETWTDGWTYDTSVVAFRLPSETAAVEIADEIPLPQGAYDLRAVGGTLWFTTTGADDAILWGDGSVSGGVVPSPAGSTDGIAYPGPWMPTTTIGTVRLGSSLVLGPSISETDHFLTLLLPEDGSALLVRDGAGVERMDMSGAAATRLWLVESPGYPVSARADPATAGVYFLAMGYGGLVSVP